MYQYRDGRPGSPTRTISFTARDREDAARLLSVIAGADQGTCSGASDVSGSEGRQPTIQDRHRLTRIAKAILEDRRRRAQLFNPSMFGEPGWELLLNLYILDTEGPRLTIGRLVQITGIAMTTALRWLDYLDCQSLVRREAHPNDARTAFVEITEKGREAFGQYLCHAITPSLDLAR